MSTRSQIEFVYKNSYKQKNGKIKNVVERTLVYRHSDGYPEGIVPDLIKFLKWNRGRNTDLEYLVANWIYYEKKSFEKYVRDDNPDYAERKPIPVTEDNIDTIDASSLQLGYGVCQPKSLHGDIEWFYRVTINPNTTNNFHTDVEITIEVYDVPFNVKYSDLNTMPPTYILKFDNEINPIDDTSVLLQKLCE